MLTKLVTIAFAVIITTPALAGPYTDALGSCLADNTTGKDRKELARWIFVAMSAHPEMRDLSNTTHVLRNTRSSRLVTFSHVS